MDSNYQTLDDFVGRLKPRLREHHQNTLPDGESHGTSASSNANFPTSSVNGRSRGKNNFRSSTSKLRARSESFSQNKHDKQSTRSDSRDRRGRFHHNFRTPFPTTRGKSRGSHFQHNQVSAECSANESIPPNFSTEHEIIGSRPNRRDRFNNVDESARSSTFERRKFISNKGHESNQDQRGQYVPRKLTIIISDGTKKNMNPENKPGVRIVGRKYLRDLSDNEITVITSEILNPDSPFFVFLQKRNLKTEWLLMIVKIVGKVCSSEFSSLKNQMLNQICRSEFLRFVSYYLGEVSIEKDKSVIDNLPSFVQDLLQFYSTLVDFLPNVARDHDIAKMISKTIVAIHSMNVYLNIAIDDDVISRLDLLNAKLKDYEEALKRPENPKPKKSRFNFHDDQPPPDDFRNLSLYPTSEDVSSYGFIRPNKIKGAYQSVEDYLDVQFRLLREDFIDPLRKGLNQYQCAKLAGEKLKFKYEQLRLYQKCVFEGVRKTDRNEMAYILIFDAKRRLRVKWEYSKRFMYGSLLLFTEDDFKTFFYGIVFGRDIKLLSEGKAMVTFPDEVDVDRDLFAKGREFLVAESEVYFGPYFLVLKSLKTFNEDIFPMKKYIVDGITDNAYPSYMQDDPSWSVNGVDVNPFAIETWPTHTELGLDLSQHRAFVKALTSEFCVIQGPPGTGKTFIGLKIVEVLLENMKLNPGKIRAPLLVVSCTNHALDQFLEGILNYTNKIIRIGAQSRSELLKDFNLRGRNQWPIRNSYEARKLLSPAVKNIRLEVKAKLEKKNSLSQQKDKFEKSEGILKYEVLQNAMTEDQRMFFLTHSLSDWLLEFSASENNSSSTFRSKKSKVVQVLSNADENESESDEEFYSEESEEDDSLFDEDDIFDVQIPSLSSDSHYELTLVQLATECERLTNRVQELQNVPLDVAVEYFAHYHHNELDLVDTKRKVYVKKYEILEEHLSNPNFCPPKNILYRDVRQLSLMERWLLYWSWVRILRETVERSLQRVEEEYRNLLAQYEDVKQIEDLYVVQRADVVGMTTTLAAKMNTFLRTLKPAIVVIEEAAEVLEQHIVTSLTKSCQQVILIGDHKQLKPSAAVFKLSKYYNIDVSLFERMINNGMDCPMLNIQHRMRPEISSLITPLIYDGLMNHESVLEFEAVKGVTKSLFFLEHNNYEQEVEDTSTRQNNFEADFLIELCSYLVLQGYDPTKITVLTTYVGQMYLLREKKRKRKLMELVKCQVVDKYQGEENDIILLSLVRSNKDARIGFLKTENRVCVALSRARKGFYIVGNMSNLTQSSPELWGKIRETLEQQNAIGKEIQLYCSRHDVYTSVSCPNDFDNVREGGCSNRCGELLDCGHSCKSLCHTLDREHKEIRCRELCRRMCARQEHECQKCCFEDCGQCTEMVQWNLPGCGHAKKLQCWVDEQTYPCDTIVDDVSPLCKHAVKRKCHERPEDVACPSKCEDRLECGHACAKTCHKRSDPEHLEYKCKKQCSRINKMCSRDHKCQKLCFQECDLCTVPVDFILNCGHQMKLSCSTDIEDYKCPKRCEKICPGCSKKCRKKCWEDCSPCENITEKQIVECGHTVRIQCCDEPEREDCSEKCERQLPCGHKCTDECCRPCGLKECNELVRLDGVTGLCAHDFVNVPCAQSNGWRLKDLLVFCDAPCNETLKCGDRCSSTCGKCWQGRLHEPCQNKCGSVGICGHSCKYPCRQVCPPCEESCGYRCVHSKCTKRCGVPCAGCKELCEWQCQHKRCTLKCGEICNRDPCYEACPKMLQCGHPCIGFCGEPCPPECRECPPEDGKSKITEIMFGYEDEEDARFVFLEDCKHTIESRALDEHLKVNPPGNEILMKLCPLCKTPITLTLRYMKYVKKVYADILAIKKRIFGTKRTLEKRRELLREKIRKFKKESAVNIKITGTKTISLIVDGFMKKIGFKNQKITVSNGDLDTIEFYIQVFTEIDSRLGDLCEEGPREGRKQLRTDPLTTEIIEYLNALLVKIHLPAVHINKQLSEDISLELRRYHKMVDFLLVMYNPSYLTRKGEVKVNNLIRQLKYEVFGVRRFIPSVEDDVNNMFEDLQTILNALTPLTKEEKRMINEAMSVNFMGGINSTGHWFTCSNGHYYVITECGGAMEKSRCPECKEVIGGENHRSVETAILASDMDGARHAAWSGLNNLGDFLF